MDNEPWEEGAVCGREYLVRCISGVQSGPGTCKPGTSWIKIKIVDYALSQKSAPAALKQSVTAAHLVLSRTAFGATAYLSRDLINVKFEEV